jgi:hypothetical protein
MASSRANVPAIAVPSPAAAQRCATGAGLDSGHNPPCRRSRSPCSAPTADDFPPTPTAPVAPQLESTGLTDATRAELALTLRWLITVLPPL